MMVELCDLSFYTTWTQMPMMVMLATVLPCFTYLPEGKDDSVKEILFMGMTGMGKKERFFF
jgi:hypothetical protein